MIKQIIDDGTLPFPTVVYLPEAMREGCPLLVQLHGAGEVGDGGEELPLVEVNGLSKLLATGKEYPCIIAMPQCPKGTFWIAEIPNIYRYIMQLCERFCVDKNRIYLTGMSMGGYGTWNTACRYPELFAAIAPVCGGGMVWAAPCLKMPIWAWHGSEDDVVYPTETINMIQKIRSARMTSAEVKLTIVDGVYHNAWDYAYCDELMQWLLSKKKDG